MHGGIVIAAKAGKSHAFKSPCPLKDVYEEFRDRETGYMDTIREFIEAEADRCIHKEKQRASREDR